MGCSLLLQDVEVDKLLHLLLALTVFGGQIDRLEQVLLGELML